MKVNSLLKLVLYTLAALGGNVRAQTSSSTALANPTTGLSFTGICPNAFNLLPAPTEICFLEEENTAYTDGHNHKKTKKPETDPKTQIKKTQQILYNELQALRQGKELSIKIPENLDLSNKMFNELTMHAYFFFTSRIMKTGDNDIHKYKILEELFKIKKGARAEVSHGVDFIGVSINKLVQKIGTEDFAVEAEKQRKFRELFYANGDAPTSMHVLYEMFFVCLEDNKEAKNFFRTNVLQRYFSENKNMMLQDHAMKTMARILVDYIDKQPDKYLSEIDCFMMLFDKHFLSEQKHVFLLYLYDEIHIRLLRNVQEKNYNKNYKTIINQLKKHFSISSREDIIETSSIKWVSYKILTFLADKNKQKSKKEFEEFLAKAIPMIDQLFKTDLIDENKKEKFSNMLENLKKSYEKEKWSEIQVGVILAGFIIALNIYLRFKKYQQENAELQQQVNQLQENANMQQQGEPNNTIQLQEQLAAINANMNILKEDLDKKKQSVQELQKKLNSLNASLPRNTENEMKRKKDIRTALQIIIYIIKNFDKNNTSTDKNDPSNKTTILATIHKFLLENYYTTNLFNVIGTEVSEEITNMLQETFFSIAEETKDEKTTTKTPSSVSASEQKNISFN